MSISLHLCVCMLACVSIYVPNWSALFSRHSCNRTGLMCNPSRHFKGRKAWTDVVLLVYQMGLYDEKSIIPIQASLPSLEHYKAIHSFFFIARNNLFFSTVPNRALVFSFSPPSLSLSSHLTSLCFSIPPCLPHLSLCPPPLSLCSWRLANVALANIQRARQAIPFYPPGPYWLSYSVCIGNECCTGAGKPHASDWYSIYMSLQDMLVWGYGFTLSHSISRFFSLCVSMPPSLHPS